jgi:hypothetical protein
MKLSPFCTRPVQRLVVCAAFCSVLAPFGCAAVATKPAGPYGEVDPATDVAPVGMHRVVLQAIDGKNVPSTGDVPATSSLMIVGPGFVLNHVQSRFWLSPGEHTLNFTAVVNRLDTTTWIHPNVNFSPQDAGVLKLNVEAGKRYDVAARVNPGQPEKWDAVVYKAEDIKDYRPGG